MNTAADPMFARLKRLPPRLRVAHLAALLRCERQANKPEHPLSCPPPRKHVRVVGRGGANDLGEGSITLDGGPRKGGCG